MSDPRGFLVPAGGGRPTRVPVANMWFKAVGEDTDGAFAFLEYVMTYDIPRHTYLREHENLYVLEGSVIVRVGDDEFSAGVGDFVFAPRGFPMPSLPPVTRRPASSLSPAPAASSTSWRT